MGQGLSQKILIPTFRGMAVIFLLRLNRRKGTMSSFPKCDADAGTYMRKLIQCIIR